MIILKKVHTYFYMFSVGFFYFMLWPLFYYFSRKPGRYKNLNKLRRFWGIISSAFAGIFYRFEYQEPVNWDKTYIICPNHTSNLDISALCKLVNSNISFMGKQELVDGLVTALFFRTVDIPVDRDSKMSSYRAFKKASEKLKEGITLIIFPEATIPDVYPPTLHPFKNGSFRLAIEMKVPVIPVSCTDTWKVLWDTGNEFGSRPGICDIFVHKPIETAHLTIDDADALRDEVYAIINKKLLSA